MRLGQPYRKQIKINYKSQFLIDLILNDKTEKKIQSKKDKKKFEPT